MTDVEKTGLFGLLAENILKSRVWNFQETIGIVLKTRNSCRIKVKNDTKE